jgi:hypothetical protein
VHGRQVQIEDFCAALPENREPRITGREARHAVEIVKAIYLSSAAGGAPVELPLTAEGGGAWACAPWGRRNRRH